jgi:uncharacterized protein (UPF0261 family)
MKNKVALIASLDTKFQETMFAKEEILRCGCQPVVIDISTKTLADRGADIGPEEILKEYGMSWEEFDPLGKAESIETMCKALAKAMPVFYSQGRFDGVISIGGGQNARMAAAAMKPLPFGVPKIVASSLACGKRTMEQYVGDNDIMVMHTVADISMLNYTTKTVIYNVCHAVVGMLQHCQEVAPDSRKKVAATMLGITSKGVEGTLRLLPDDTFEKTCFHANGVGGRCMESLIRAGKFDLVLDMTLHELTCEVLGGYCTGAHNRLSAAIQQGIPMVVVPGALDMLDFFIDEEGNGLPKDIDRRKKIYHNSSICHTKIYKEEAIQLAQVLAQRLNQATAPVTLVLPDGGCCEAAAKGGPMYDPEVDQTFIATIKPLLKKEIKVIDVPGNINDEACQKAIAAALMEMAS